MLNNNTLEEYLSDIYNPSICSTVGLVSELKKSCYQIINIPLYITPLSIEEYFKDNGFECIKDTNISYYESYRVTFIKNDIKIVYYGRNYYNNKNYLFLHTNDLKVQI